MQTTDLMFWVIILSVAFPVVVVALTELRSRVQSETALQLIRISTNSTVPVLAPMFQKSGVRPSNSVWVQGDQRP